MDWFPKSRPRRPAKEGLPTRKRPAEYSWWSRRFVSILESFGDASRLQRGRSYARSGQVMDLSVGPGRVAARVQGSRRAPYRVEIALSVLSPEQWEAIDQALAAQALYAAALLSGEMPPEIEALFASAGHPLFPTRSGDLRTSCTCPDWANPCKHVAATYYVLAERFDQDPFSILAWRGREREALMEALRARRTEPEAAGASAEPAPEPLDLSRFWDAGPDALALRFRPADAPAPGALARRLGPLIRGGSDLADALAPAWQTIAEGAIVRASEDGSEAE